MVTLVSIASTALQDVKEMFDYELENEIADNDERQWKHDVSCECPECTGEADAERVAERKIKDWDRENIIW